MAGVDEVDSVTRRVDGPAAPACGVDEVVPEDLAVPEQTREGRDAGASERSDQARRSPISPTHPKPLRRANPIRRRAPTRYP